MTCPPSTRSSSSARVKRQLSGAAVLAAWLYAGCSVYDSSLLPSANMPDGAAGSGDAGSAPIAGAKADSGSGGSGSGEVGGGGSTANVSGASSGATSAGGASGSRALGEGGSASSGGEADGGTGMTDGGGPPGAVSMELALGKSALASTTQTGNDATRGNDGDLVTRWCAVNGNFPQWWRVDLGDLHQLESFALRFEYPERAHSFLVEVSADDVSYSAVPGAAFTDVVGELQSGDFPDGSAARYVRISITNAAPPTDPNETPHVTWASFFEFSVMGF